MKTTNKIYSDEEENEVGPSTTTWDAQSALLMEQVKDSIKNIFPARI